MRQCPKVTEINSPGSEKVNTTVITAGSGRQLNAKAVHRNSTFSSVGLLKMSKPTLKLPVTTEPH